MVLIVRVCKELRLLGKTFDTCLLEIIQPMMKSTISPQEGKIFEQAKLAQEGVPRWLRPSFLYGILANFNKW